MPENQKSKTKKFRKYFRPFAGKGNSSRGYMIDKGDFGLKVHSAGQLTSSQMEAGRRAIVKATGRKGLMWQRVFTDMPVTKKAQDTRMGGGKGSVDHWACSVEPGRIIYEIVGLPEILSRKALTLAASKLPFKTSIVKRQETII
jgi:large subunit ribosomal protein L16